jgi:hypothetical protein
MAHHIAATAGTSAAGGYPFQSLMLSGAGCDLWKYMFKTSTGARTT